MKKLFLSIALATGCLCSMGADIKFSDYFYDKTMRFDYYHAGDAKNEMFYFDELKEEPYFAGSKASLIDNNGYGNLMFKIIDKESGKTIFQKGYCTLFSEWALTDEALQTQKAFPEGVVFPYPKKDATIEIYSRDKKNIFHKRFSYDINPNSYFVHQFSPVYETFDVAYHGNSEHRMDIVLIPEGYSEQDKAKFEEACQNFAKAMITYSPFKEYADKINIRAVWAPSAQSGVTIPGEHVWKHTATNARFYTFDSERYQMIDDQQSLLDIAAHAPYDYIYVLSNTQKYGGGAIYNFYGISAANHPTSTNKVYVHEFGHLLMGLGDEYVGGSECNDMYPAGVEPWEENITTLADFDKKDWKKMLNPKTPIPTPVPKSKNPKDWTLGVYEGGGYVEKGVYRPMPNCMMNWLHTIDEFCPVCQHAIKKYLDFICK